MLPECAAVLVKLCAGLEQTEKAFPSVPIPRTFNRGLRRAGVAKRNERGRQADFHALRDYFCTLTGRRLPIQTVRLLMRHRDIRTTCNLYMDLEIETWRQKLPNFRVYYHWFYHSRFLSS